MPHLFLFSTTYTGFLLFCFVTSEKWLYWPFMQGWRGLEASRVKRYRLGKDRKIGSFGQWIPIYQHPPSPLLILNHFLLILVLLPAQSWQFRPTGLSGNWWTPWTGNRPMATILLYLLLGTRTRQKCENTYTFSRGIRTRNASFRDRMRLLLRGHEV